MHFDKMYTKDIISWNTMISVFVKLGSIQDAHQLFDKIHERNVISRNAVSVGYSRHGYPVETMELFEQMQVAGFEWDCITYAFVLSACTNLPSLEQGHARQGHGEETLILYFQMQREDMKHDRISFADGLGACASLLDEEYGKLIHTYITKTRFEFEGFTGSSIVDMYAKCGSIEDA